MVCFQVNSLTEGICATCQCALLLPALSFSALSPVISLSACLSGDLHFPFLHVISSIALGDTVADVSASVPADEDLDIIRLPIAVLRCIAQQLTHADVESARLACRAWKTAFGAAAVTDMYMGEHSLLPPCH